MSIYFSMIWMLKLNNSQKVDIADHLLEAMEYFSKSGARITERIKIFCNETDDVKARIIISDVILERVIED